MFFTFLFSLSDCHISGRVLLCICLVSFFFVLCKSVVKKKNKINLLFIIKIMEDSVKLRLTKMAVRELIYKVVKSVVFLVTYTKKKHW